MRVLIIEDELRLAENVARTLRETAGYAVDVAADGQEGLFLAESNTYDAVLLDLMLPKLEGMQVLKCIRESGQHTPVLVLTARDDKESIVALLNAGADDYLTKPFDLGELLARTKALIRRGKGQPSPVLTIGDLQLNTVDRSVQRAGRPITLLPWNTGCLSISRIVRAPSSRKPNCSSISMTTTGRSSAT